MNTNSYELDELDKLNEIYEEDLDVKVCSICGKEYTAENVEPLCTDCMRIKYMSRFSGNLFGGRR